MQMIEVPNSLCSDRRGLARSVRDAQAGRVVHVRGVIEFTNVCHHNCLYCGMRVANKSLGRYTLDRERLTDLAAGARADGIRTIMIQGGDHLEYDVAELCRAVGDIRERFDQTVLLCLGDRPLRDYEELFAAGAAQAIVKFETSNRSLYRRLRPHSHLDERLKLVNDLWGLGYEVSSGFILGLPGATAEDAENDLKLVSELPLFAASVSPFIPNDQSPLAGATVPSLDSVLDCIAGLRIRNPWLRIPSVSALNLLASLEGREEPGQLLGLMAGANVLTINYTPPAQQKSYVIYTSRRSLIEVGYAKELVKLTGLETDCLPTL